MTQKQTVSTFHAKTKDCVKPVNAQLDKIPRAQKCVPQIPITRRSGIKMKTNQELTVAVGE